jgi:hypothetical protein
MSKFYLYSQNNSGGSFDHDKPSGITEYVIVEADSAKHANYLAEGIGIYFDGCDTGNDCPCCGDRWYTADESDGSDLPMVYGTPAQEYKSMWYDKEDAICVHYLDGRREWH